MDAAARKALLQRILVMKITEKELIEIINEEIKNMIKNDDIDEGVLDRLKAKGAGALSGISSKVAGAFGKDTSDMDASQKLKQASSLMKSYDKQLLKLAQSLQTDAAELGIEDQTKAVQQAINQTRAQVRGLAKDAPTSARMQRMDQQRAQQQGRQQTTPAAAQPAAAPAAAETAAAPAAAEPAAAAQPAQAATPAAQPAQAATPAAQPAQAATPDADQEKRDRRNARRRELRAQKKAAAAADRAKKDKRNARDRARRTAARQAASAVPAANAQARNESKKPLRGESLNEQLQKISERWGFGK